MNQTKGAIIASSLLLLTADHSLSAASLATWTTTPGNTTGSGLLAGGTVSWSISYFSNSDGIRIAGDRDGPLAVDSFEGSINPFGSFDNSLLEALVVNAGAIDESDFNNVGYTLNFTFDDGNGGDTFPADSVFFLSDLEAGTLEVEASYQGNPLSPSNWYEGTVQTQPGTPGDLPSPGSPPTWDGTTDLLDASGSGDLWVSEFEPDTAFDSLSFTFTGEGSPGDVDSIYYGIKAIPEPSTTLLNTILLVSALAFRRRG